MLKISRNGTGFKILVSAPGSGSRGYRCQALNVNEAALAVLHYYGCGPCAPGCPMCRDIQAMAKKKEKSR